MSKTPVETLSLRTTLGASVYANMFASLHPYKTRSEMARAALDAADDFINALKAEAIERSKQQAETERLVKP